MARNYAALPHEYLEEMDILSNAEFGRLCRALLRYSIDGTEGRLEGAEKVTWKRVKNQEDRFQESYKEMTESRRKAGKKGAAKRWQSMASDGKNGKTETETETETETDILPSNDGKDIEGADKPPHRPHFVPPTVEEVEEYCRERGNCVDPEKFVDFYTANGWKQGKGKPIVDWKACVRTWEARMKEDNKRTGGNIFMDMLREEEVGGSG